MAYPKKRTAVVQVLAAASLLFLTVALSLPSQSGAAQEVVEFSVPNPTPKGPWK